MNKRYTILLMSIFLFILILFIIPQQSEGQIYRIGVLLTGENRLVKLEGMKDGLAELGYDLNTFEFIVFDAKEDSDQLKVLAKEMLSMELQLIVTLGGIETQVIEREMKLANKEIPTVFVGIAAPYELGLIDEYNRPGTTFTGVNNYHMNLSSKRLEMFKELIPGLETVYVLYSGGVEISEMSLQITKEVAQLLQIDMVEIDFNRTGALRQLEASLNVGDGIFVLPSYQIEANTEEIAQVAMEHHVPSMGIYDTDVEAGYLFSYGSTFYEQGYQASRHVSLILQGNKPHDLPVELPDAIKFLVNNSVMKKLDLEINNDILKLADIYEGNVE